MRACPAFGGATLRIILEESNPALARSQPPNNTAAITSVAQDQTVLPPTPKARRQANQKHGVVATASKYGEARASSAASRFLRRPCRLRHPSAGRCPRK